MSAFDYGLWAGPALAALLLLRIPIGLALLALAAAGWRLSLGSWAPFMGQLKSLSYDVFSNHTLAIVPMFLLMGQFAARGGISEALFRAADARLGALRGGPAMAAVGACGVFGAMCGSSLATAAAMGRAALPELRRRGCPGGLATGVLAAGGTLGILIPPSVALIIYASLTEQSVSKLFIAAMIPGLLAMLGYMAVAAMMSPPGANNTRAQTPGPSIWPAVAVLVVMLGGIYTGRFTPNEGAAVGALGVGAIAWFNGGLDWKGLRECLLETAAASGMIYLIVLGAAAFNGFLAFTQIPQQAAEAVAQSGLSPWAVMALILVGYVVLGCVMESLSMILLTTPILFPLVVGLDFGLSYEETALWFGVLTLTAVEVGLITPPIGLNLFVINRLAPDVSLAQTYRGAAPFIASDIARIGLMIAFPALSLWLVRLWAGL